MIFQRIWGLKFPVLAALMPLSAAVFSLGHSSQVNHSPSPAPRAASEHPAKGHSRLYVTYPNLRHEYLVENATDIVHGSVIGVTPFVFRPGWVSRRVEVLVKRRWKGGHDQIVTIMLHGGVLDGVRTTAPGFPEVFVGEEYVLYLDDFDAHFGALLLGAEQGAHMALADDSGNTLVSMGGDIISLDALVQRDRSILEKSYQAENEGESR